MKKKKLIGNLFLAVFVVGLGLSFIDFKSDPDTFEGSIQSFIYDRLSDNKESLHYTPLTFQEIDESFLLALQEVTAPMQVVADSMQNQLKLMRNAAGNAAFQNSIATAELTLKNLKLTNIDELLQLDASLKRTIKNANRLNTEEQSALHTEETRMMRAINEINAALGTYNLSIFSIDFEQTDTKHFYHTFLLSEENSVNITNHQAVFEINTKDKNVISFNEI